MARHTENGRYSRNLPGCRYITVHYHVAIRDKDINYRPEIDGLRTIAVLSVIIYHAEFVLNGQQVLTGGFVGVDIFFVISGYLITTLLINELDNTGTISFSNFYERRARRLLPALVLVTLITLLFTWPYFLPDQLLDYALSVITSIFFSSNFYWYSAMQTYGAESALLKPFLHTWSLAVEEQYYIIYPLIIIALHKYTRRHVFTILITGILVSLTYAEWLTPRNASLSFYMLPSRFWELLSGGLLAYTTHIYGRAPRQAMILYRAMPSLGMALITYSLLYLNIETATHPGLVTILPVAGTLLIIHFADIREPVTKVLSSRIFVGIGMISYSLYLWHYPIFAFLRKQALFGLGVEKIPAIILTFLLSYISYTFVERAFRSKNRIPLPVFIRAGTASVLVILIAATAIITNHGFPERFKGVLATSVNDMKAYRKKYWSNHSAYTEISDFSSDKTSIEVIGNSWAQDIANALTENGNYQVGYQGTTGHQCLAITLPRVPEDNKEYTKIRNRCQANINRFKQTLPKTDLVILADDLSLADVDNPRVQTEVSENIDLLRKHGYDGPVLVIAQRPKYTNPVFAIILEYGISGDSVNQYAQHYLELPIAALRHRDLKAGKYYQDHDIFYYSLVDDLCDATVCKITVDGTPLYHDKSHLTWRGVKYISVALSKYIEYAVLANNTHRPPPQHLAEANSNR